MEQSKYDRMVSDAAQNPLDPACFEGRRLIDFLEAHRKLRVAIEGGAKRQGTLTTELTYGRDLVIQGRIRAPRELPGKLIKVTLSPFGRKVRFGVRTCKSTTMFLRRRVTALSKAAC